MNNLPFHDPQGNPLPDANDIERETDSDLESDSFQEGSPTRSPSPHVKQDIQKLRNIFIGLILAGVAIGCVVGFGVIVVLNRTGLLDPPEPNRGQLYERLVTSDRNASR